MLNLQNLLEPMALIRHFYDHPPEGFAAFALRGDVPAFSAEFDLFTTLDAKTRRRLRALPLYRWWSRWFRHRTCFVGTTVSEYAPLPDDPAAGELARTITCDVVPAYPIVIVKDLPVEAILVGEEALNYSSALARACGEAGFLLVEGQALAYVPIDFHSTNEYLSRLSHARRKNLRRKLRSCASLDIEAVKTGDARFADPGFTTDLYALYRNVYEQSDIHFDLLTESFFRAVMQDAAIGGVVFLYRAGGALTGWNLCLQSEGMLIDKYVGFAYPEALRHELYTVSWFHNLEYARVAGCRYYVAGWTDPEIKRRLGAKFTWTRHAVHIRNPVLRTLLVPFREMFESDRNWQRTDGAIPHS